MPTLTRARAVSNPFENGVTRRISLAARRPDTSAVVRSEHQLHADLASPDHAVRLRAIRHFNAVAVAARRVLLSTTSNFPDQQTEGVPTVVAFGDADRHQADVRFRALFDMRDRTSDGHPFFKITDVYDALFFEEYEMGERIKASTVRADDQVFETPIVAGALQWNQFWANWQSLWSEGDGIASMNAKWLRRMYQKAMDVLTAAGLEVTPYDAAGASQLEKDVNTINAGITALGNAIYQTETGFEGVVSEEDIEGTALYLLYNPATAGYRNRVNRALSARFDLANDNNSAAEVDVPVMPFPSRRVPANGWWLVLPNRKLVGVVKKDLEIYDRTDPRYAGITDDRIGQGAYQLVRGDSRQVRQLATS